MAIKFRCITELVVNPQRTLSIVSIFNRYRELKDQFDNPEKQSWYFKKGIASRQKQFADLHIEYTNYRRSFNKHTVDSLKEAIKEIDRKIEGAKVMNGYLIRTIALGSFTGTREYLEELLLLKSRVNELKEIDFYLNNEDEFLKLVE